MEFLTIEDVLILHADLIELFGGKHGVRDVGLLESALAQPRATFGGESLHSDIFDMAAAYMFHIIQNHPLIDGNKRTDSSAALVFLDRNGLEVEAPEAVCTT